MRDAAFIDADFLALAQKHGLGTVYTDSPEHPSFADVTAGFVYARMMRSRSAVASGYRSNELKAWGQRAKQWASGNAPDDLEYVEARPAAGSPRDVFVYFINAAKERNPAAAMAMIEKLHGH